MINSTSQSNTRVPRKKRRNNGKNNQNPRKLTSMCKVSTEIINQLYNPIDAINRFINLALQTIGDDSLSRQFLVESKQGIRKTSLLLRRLNNYAKKMEAEIYKLPPTE